MGLQRGRSSNASRKAQKSPKSGWGQTSECIPAVTAPLQQQQSPKSPHTRELHIPVPVICWVRVSVELPHGGTQCWGLSRAGIGVHHLLSTMP